MNGKKTALAISIIGVTLVAGWLWFLSGNKKASGEVSELRSLIEAKASFRDVLDRAAQAQFKIVNPQIEDPAISIPADHPQSRDQWSTMTEKNVSELLKAKSGTVSLTLRGYFIRLTLKNGEISSAEYIQPR